MTKRLAEIAPPVRAPGILHSETKAARACDISQPRWKRYKELGLINVVTIGGRDKVRDEEITRIQTEGISVKLDRFGNVVEPKEEKPARPKAASTRRSYRRPA
jgi:hypothetical protein